MSESEHSLSINYDKRFHELYKTDSSSSKDMLTHSRPLVMSGMRLWQLGVLNLNKKKANR